MSLLQRLTPNRPKADISDLTWDGYQELLGRFTFNGLEYGGLNQTYSTGGKTREIVPSYLGYADAALRRNGIVWACVTTRNMLFAEAVFQFRRKGQTGSNALFGTQALLPLESPWPGGDTRKLLALMELDVQLAGNGYAYRDPLNGALRPLRPDWVTIVLGSADPNGQVGDASTEILGYWYRPNGDSELGVAINPAQMAHFMPNPDPIFRYRGVSWLGPVLREIEADTGMTEHKLRFLENGATSNMVVTLSPNIRKDEFDGWIEKFEAGHKGVANAYKTIYLGGGADASVVGANLSQMDFKNVQAHDETRICNAAGIPPIIVGVSEGLDSATYSNYAQARRAWADSRLRPMWAGVCSELSKLITVPGGCEVWYDERRIAFLAEDLKDQAEILQTQAVTMQNLIVSGWTPESAQAFVETGDLSKLTHTGLYSIQLQPPGTTIPNGAPAPVGGPNAPAASLWCSTCSEPAASNGERCSKCAEFASAVAQNLPKTAAKVAEQLGLTKDDILSLLGHGPVPKFEVSGPVEDLLTPEFVVNNGHLK